MKCLSKDKRPVRLENISNNEEKAAKTCPPPQWPKAETYKLPQWHLNPWTCYHVLMWDSNLTMASKLVVKPQKQQSIMYDEGLKNKDDRIINDPSDPPYSEVELLPKGRRYRSLMANRNIYQEILCPKCCQGNK